MILDDIIVNKRHELLRWQTHLPLSKVREEASAALPPRNFSSALLPSQESGRAEYRIIAEIKKASPSKGVIRKDFDPVDIAKIYESCGAAAISVLTDSRFFLGDITYLRHVRKVTALPLLMKDFIIDPYQIYLARMFGADAVLLITALLDSDQLATFINLAHSLGMQVLVEVHSIDDVRKALAVDAQIIGINNRDLKTFEVTIETTRRLAPLIGTGRIVVSESGIESKEIMCSLARLGVHAFLVGEALMRSKDIKAALTSFLQ